VLFLVVVYYMSSTKEDELFFVSAPSTNGAQSPIPNNPGDDGGGSGSGDGGGDGSDPGGGGGGPLPPPPPQGGVGPDGVAQLFPDAPGTHWYLNMSAPVDPHDDHFNISYGSGSHIKSTKHTEAGVTFFNSEGAVQNYASGSPSSRSCRFDNYPGLGQGSSAKFAWNSKPKPDFLYNAQGIRNREMTIFLRPHGQLKTHESCAFKVGGRDNDDVRSAIEIVYPTATHSTVIVNYNFAHFPYVEEKNTKQIFTGDKLTDGKWVGVKCITKVSDDGKTQYLAIYADLTPFKADGSLNNQFKLKAECVTKGVKEYDNVVCSWKCQKDVMRVDGFRNVDYTLYSDREISNAGMKMSL
jgi:hypothetical protein